MVRRKTSIKVDRRAQAKTRSLQTSVRVKDARHSVSTESLVPVNAGDYSEGLVDILDRMDTGYWPSIDVSYGWYSLITELNDSLKFVCPSYKIRELKSEDGALFFAFRVPDDLSPEKCREMMNVVRMSIARSRSICEECGQLGEETYVNHIAKVLCASHTPKTKTRRKKTDDRESGID